MLHITVCVQIMNCPELYEKENEQKMKHNCSKPQRRKDFVVLHLHLSVQEKFAQECDLLLPPHDLLLLGNVRHRLPVENKQLNLMSCISTLLSCEFTSQT